MPIHNFEIKARTNDPDAVRSYLQQNGAKHIGTDRQIDTYYKVPSGRLKLREGTIERSLIHYIRDNVTGPKLSAVRLMKLESTAEIKSILEAALDVLVVVDKTRDIYFLDNVKFHIDHLTDQGDFVEIEAIDSDGSLGIDHIRTQCESHMYNLGIGQEALLSDSYSDIIMNNARSD